MTELDFYAVVTVADTEHTRSLDISGQRGVVIGKAEDDNGQIVGYSVLIDDCAYSVGPDDIVPTGQRLNREDIYSGESIRVSALGEYRGPGRQLPDVE